MAIPILGTVLPIHWMFSDRAGESTVVESDRDGLYIYRNTVGAITNSPGYPWHRTSLLNYPQLRPLDYGELAWGRERLGPYFPGSGAAGLPGDRSSSSRFVWPASLQEHAVKSGDEVEGASPLFHLLHSAAFLLGAMELVGPGEITPHDRGVVPYDYTVYFFVLCAEPMRFHWPTYRNSRVHYVEPSRLLKGDHPLQFTLEGEPELYDVTSEGV